MDRDRVRAIAHRDHPFHGPLGEGALESIVARVSLPAHGWVVDIGCGEGDMLLRLLAVHTDLHGEGIDRAEPLVTRARSRVAERLTPGRCRMHLGDARQFQPSKPAHVVVCSGAAHIFGGLRGTLRAVKPWLAPGGQVLISEQFWERAPDARALAALEANADDYQDLASTVEAAEAEGFVPAYMSVSDAGDWDHYESLWCASIEEHVRATPGDPDARELLAAAHAHRTAYLRGYRGVLGYVTLLLSRSP
ncbi:MAG: class I SAM-dependent methyltransferase [Deltaproteobacteria bacterium]